MDEPRILLVEDDTELRDLLTRGLTESDFKVWAVGTGHDAMARVHAVDPAALVIDIGLPDTDGRDLCQALRARGTTAPVLFLTARDALTDRLSGFAAGGDDYVTKPFYIDEVIARLLSLLKRTGHDPTTDAGDLRLDPVAHGLSGGLGATTLTPTEFRLLAALAAHRGSLVRRSDLLRTAWPEGAIVHDNTLDVYIGRLRRHLRQVSDVSVIATIHGVGYRLE